MTVMETSYLLAGRVERERKKYNEKVNLAFSTRHVLSCWSVKVDK